MAIFRAFKDEWDAALQAKANERHNKLVAKIPPVVPKSALDPTRRYKANRTLGLASIVKSNLDESATKSASDLLVDGEPAAPVKTKEKTTVAATNKSRSAAAKKQVREHQPAGASRSKRTDDEWWTKL